MADKGSIRNRPVRRTISGIGSFSRNDIRLMMFKNSMLITPLPPPLAALGEASHGPNLNGNHAPAWVSSKWKSTEYQSEAAALMAIAGKLGCSPDNIRVWARQVQRDGGERPGVTSAENLRIKVLERENRELRQANEILRQASAYFAQSLSEK